MQTGCSREREVVCCYLRIIHRSMQTHFQRTILAIFPPRSFLPIKRSCCILQTSQVTGGFSVPFCQGFSFPVFIFGVKCGPPTPFPKDISCWKRHGGSSLASVFCLYLKGVVLIVWVWILSEDWSEQEPAAALGYLSQRSFANLKLASAPPNGTVAVWECLLPNSFLELQQFPGKVDGNRKAARETAKHSLPLIS